MLIRTVAKGGHIYCILCSATFRFNELKALLGSTKIIPYVSSALYMSFSTCIAASAPPFNPALTCKCPTAICLSAVRTQHIAFPMIRRRISPIPIGRTPGFLFRGISRHETYGSNTSGSIY